MRENVQKFGRFLSGMVMPNIGAFIAWGFITALFIDTGWIPNADLSTLVGPMITYLLPVLIGYTGGKLVHGTRGAVVGAVATMGVIVGSSITMFLGAMIVGPLGGWLMKKFDQALEGKIPAGFEMLVNNFSAGILGLLIAIVSFWGIGPIVEVLNTALGNGVKAIVDAGLLPLTSLIVEPAKVLFLNNAINHGVFGPLGLEQASELGKSIFFLIETNPGPGLGVLLACTLFGKGAAKESAPGAIIIHFFGGIHEIYFPYILMNPLLLLAVIAGGAAGVLTFSILGAGLVAAASPGSIIAVLAMAPRGGFLPVLLGVVVAAAVSFVVAAAIYRFSSEKEGDLEASKARVSELKATGTTKAQSVSKIVFACDAGMGSSAMGATTLQRKLKEVGSDIKVTHSAIEDIDADADLVVTHESLYDRAKSKVPNTEIITIKNFVGAPEYEDIVQRFKK